ncbi:MAG: T9SS type A sorting domain-containing protein [Bacteroidetes bacterium]|nr:T9SS type A sorting domain-containing protein [Bacteroidota bacterium]
MYTYGTIVRTIVCIVALNGIAFAQTAPIDFEAGGNGADWTWAVFENDTNPALEIVSNPDASGINTSSTVAKFTALQSGNPWAGTESQHGADIGTFTLDESNCTVKIMVHKSTISDVGIKFATATGASTGEIKVANTLVNQWEELVFDFSGKIGQVESTDIDQIIIFPDFDVAGRTGDNIIYFDNITFSEKIATTTGPTVPASTPTAAANDVISLFSNAYTNVPVDTWSAVWDNADIADVQIAGDDVKKYSNLVFAGVEFTSQTIDASGMTHFHMDIWTPDPTDDPAAFRVKLVDFGADGAYGGGDDVEHELAFTASNTPGFASEIWVSLDIPLTSFTGLVTREHLAQMVILGDLKTVYVDNVYFWRGATEAVPTVAAPAPTAAADDVVSLFSNAYTNVSVDTWSAVWDQADLTEIQIEGDDVKKYSNLVFAGVEFTSQPIDATDMTHFHMDIWTPGPTDDPASIRIKLVDFGADGAFGGGDDVEHELAFTASTTPALVPETWIALDMPLVDFTGLVTRGNIAQMVISSDPNTVYIDNVYFYKESSTAVEDIPAGMVAGYALGQNYPNPFNPTTSIRFQLPAAEHVTLTVFNAIGQPVATLVDRELTAGTHDVTFDAAGLPSGTYTYVLSSGSYTSVKRMMLVK